MANAAATKSATEGKEIIVVSEGFVFLGEVTEVTHEFVKLEDASVIRRWGTSRGLGQIALEGVQKETELDQCGSTLIERSKVLFRIKCRV